MNSKNLLSLQLVSFLLPDVFCLRVRIFRLVLILFYIYIHTYMYSTSIPPIMIINRIYEHQNLLSLQLVSFLFGLRTYQHPLYTYRGADKFLAQPTFRCILFDGENISFDASLVVYVYINSTNIPPIVIIKRIYEYQKSSVAVACFLPVRAKDLSALLIYVQGC